MGQVPNCDASSKDFDCFLETNSGRYFLRNNQKYYKVGDLLTMRQIVNAFQFSGHTSNFVYFWSCCCKHTHKLEREKKRVEREREKEDKNNSKMDLNRKLEKMCS